MYRESEVRRGIVLLDEKLPDWRIRFDPGNLDMSRCSTCVLGQVFGSYGEGLVALGVNYEQAPVYGFDLPNIPSNSTEWEFSMAQYREFGNTWRNLTNPPRSDLVRI